MELNFIILRYVGDTVIDLRGCHCGQRRKYQPTKREQYPVDTFVFSPSMVAEFQRQATVYGGEGVLESAV